MSLRPNLKAIAAIKHEEQEYASEKLKPGDYPALAALKIGL